MTQNELELRNYAMCSGGTYPGQTVRPAAFFLGVIVISTQLKMEG
jgi:hypothetical protein